MGATVSVSTTVSPGQTYYFKVLSAGGYGPIGGYGLLVNMGSQTQSPIAPPDTVVAQQPDQGGGSVNNGISVPGLVNAGNNTSAPTVPVYTTIGSLHGWALVFAGATAASTSPASQPVIVPPVSAPPQSPISPIATTPAPGLSPLTASTVPTTKHHVKWNQYPNVSRFAVGHRTVQVKDHAKPKLHHKV
jgi:hypothetical protein